MLVYPQKWKVGLKVPVNVLTNEKGKSLEVNLETCSVQKTSDVKRKETTSGCRFFCGNVFYRLDTFVRHCSHRDKLSERPAGKGIGTRTQKPIHTRHGFANLGRNSEKNNRHFLHYSFAKNS